jgi:hypothetical protein
MLRKVKGGKDGLEGGEPVVCTLAGKRQQDTPRGGGWSGAQSFTWNALWFRRKLDHALPSCWWNSCRHRDFRVSVSHPLPSHLFPPFKLWPGM